MRRTPFCALATLTLLLVAGVGVGQNLPKLPADVALPQSGDSPGVVTFSHQNHVGFQSKVDCTACHPKLAPILKRTPQVKRDAITHAKMEKGQSCGACHDGKKAHGFEDCTSCHRS